MKWQQINFMGIADEKQSPLNLTTKQSKVTPNATSSICKNVVSA